MSRASASFGTMLGVLMHMQFARLRRNWRPYIVVSAVMPAGIVLLLHLTNAHMSRTQEINVISGAMLLAQAISAIAMLSQHVAWLKGSRALDHYRVLPISLEVLVISLASVYSLFAWPGVLLIALEGTYLDRVPMHFSLIMVVLLLLTGVAMGSIGVIVGLLAPDEGLAGLFGNLIMMSVLFAGMVPLPALGRSRLALWILPSTGPSTILKGLLFHIPVLAWPQWVGLVAYTFLALTIGTAILKRPS
jgi:hypothetical protein